MTESYLDRKKQNDEMEDLKNKSVFGLMGGIMLMVIGALKWITAERPWDIFYTCLFALGVIFFLFGLIVPAFLKYPYTAFRFWGNLVGKAVFSVALTLLYVLFIFPVGLLLRGKREARGYYIWEKEEEKPEPRSMFADIEKTDSRDRSKNKRASYAGIMYKLFSGLVTNRKFILIPTVIILMIVGLILFFVSSNVVTSFIYTIF